GGLPGAGPLEHRAGVVQRVLRHADEVGVSRAGPGERLVAGQLAVVTGAGVHLEQAGVDRVGGHDGLPLGPLGVADLDGDRPTHGATVPDPPEEPDLVLLELHPGAAAVAEAPPGEHGADVVGGDLHPGRYALENPDEGLAVRLP